MGNEGVFAIILKEDNSLVGSIGIITDPKRENTRTRMLGYWLKECHWGKGMASEATRTILDYGFNVLGLHLISANCYPHNTRSRLLLERNGFVYEGILHEAEMTYDGHVYDHLCFYQKKERDAHGPKKILRMISANRSTELNKPNKITKRYSAVKIYCQRGGIMT